MNINEMISSIAKNVPNEQNDTDYEVDGLMFCGICNTPKQCKINIFDEDKIVPCVCKCQKEKMQADEEQRKRAERQKEVERFRRMGFPESEMENWTFANDDGTNKKISDAMKRYVERFEEFKADGKGMLLFGSVGTGKTYAAACVANALIDRGYPCLVTNFARLANTLQGMYDGKQEYIDSLNRFDLLVIDDLSAERDTEYMQEQVFNIINARYNAGLPMIITSNLTSKELANPNGISKSRIYSRILEKCYPIQINGEDRRRNKMKEQINTMRDILGV